jgi:hypothetical protein
LKTSETEAKPDPVRLVSLRNETKLDAKPAHPTSFLDQDPDTYKLVRVRVTNPNLKKILRATVQNLEKI